MTRSPAAEAPTQALIAECSDSTVTYSVCTRPFATNLANSSTIVVCGVMGYAAIMSGAHWRMASATSTLPVTARVFWVGIYLFTSGSSQPSGTIVMASDGQTLAHTPQPLQ